VSKRQYYYYYYCDIVLCCDSSSAAVQESRDICISPSARHMCQGDRRRFKNDAIAGRGVILTATQNGTHTAITGARFYRAEFFLFPVHRSAAADKPDGEGCATTAGRGTGSASDCETPHEGRASTIVVSRGGLRSGR